MSAEQSKELNHKRGTKRKLDLGSRDSALEVLEKKARLVVEEEMTQSRIRKCPGCGKPVVKDGGCNRVHCKCGQVFCFNCGNPVHRCRYSICRFYRNISPIKAARRVMHRLRRRYPALTFKECMTLLTEESEEEKDFDETI